MLNISKHFYEICKLNAYILNFKRTRTEKIVLKNTIKGLALRVIKMVCKATIIKLVYHNRHT